LLFNAEDKLKTQLKDTENQWQNYQQRESNLSGLSTALMLFANGLLLATTLWFAAAADFGSDTYKAAFIGLFTFAALAAFEILMPIGSAFLHIGQVIASAQNVTEIMEQQPLVQFNGTESAVDFSDILFDIQNLDFHYPERQDMALHQLNVQIPAQSKVAILGKTGSGKSTLLQLLVRNYEPTQGSIQLGQKPISAYSETALREHIGFLTQRVHVFSDSLRQNLQIANKATLSDERMINVLNAVGLEKLLEDEKGLDQWLGDGGRPLSGGEQRRLGLARILLNDAPILLLDEPTEGLDRETERQVLQLILQHAQHKTLIMVTHRLTAIEQFDQILVIDQAELVEQGSFNQLMQKETGFFKELYERI